MSSRRRVSATLLATLVATAVVWLAAHRLDWPARSFTTFLLVLLPALLLVQGRISEQDIREELSRQAIYFSSALSIWVLAILAMIAASTSGFIRHEMGLQAGALEPLAAATVLATLGGLAIMAAGRLLGVRETGLLHYLLPVTTGDRIAFVGLSISAGVGEEVVFRSFLIPALQTTTGSLWLAVGLSSVAFGLVHSYQGTAGVARASLLGVVLAAPFILTGSIYPSIAAHAALDILAGIYLADWLIDR